MKLRQLFVRNYGLQETLMKPNFPLIGNRTCLHIGFGSFLNSSDTPNVKHIRIDYNLHMSYFEVISDIEIDEELTLNYLLNNK